jgi:hypothetical protein
MLQLVKLRKMKYIIVIFTLLFALTELSPIIMAEEQRSTYYGDNGADSVLNYLKYSDINANLWSKQAVYETGALGILKGFRDASGRFGRTVPITKEEAIAVAYRAAGREAEAQQLGNELNNARANKKTDPLEVLYDGFLQLAANEGLISARNLTDALYADQTGLPGSSFSRKSPAQRQEMIYWLASALGIQPEAIQQEVLNYSDWRSTDPDKLPYVEAFLRRGIISGSNNKISPTQSITREQCAQIVKNAEGEVLTANNYVKNSGIVEKILSTSDYTSDIIKSGKEIYVTNANGSYSVILTAAQSGTASGGRNENAGSALPAQKSEIIVYKDGAIGNSSLLEKGDRLYYICDSNNKVKYVEVVSNVNDVRYIAVQIQNIDQANLLLDIVQLFETDYPDMRDIIDGNSFSWSGTEKKTYRIGKGIPVSINGVKAKLADVTNDAVAILTIDSNNVISEIQCVDIGINAEARRIVRGIVEENNPSLGFITLFNEDGSGTGSSSWAVLRTYNYIDQNKTEVFRNHKSASIESVRAGDTVYLRLDKNGDIESISAVDNYSTAYVKVISKMPSQIAVEYEDGIQQILDIDEDIIVIRDKMLVGVDSIRDGDRIRMVLNETSKLTEIIEITIEGDEHFISNIYRGKITKLDDISGKITVLGMYVFDRGNWELTERKGFTTVPLAEGYKIYANNKLLDIDAANKLLYNNDAYIAVEKTYGGEERAVVISYRDSMDTEVTVTSDKISGVTSGSNSFTIANDNKKVKFSDGSIVVKYGRLVAGNSLSSDDKAYMTVNRDYSSGEYYASVIKVDEMVNQNTLVIYRGRISDIVENKSFTAESFSQLQGTDWKYYNTPKTFNITLDTRVLTDEGVLNVREFVGYGDDNYLRRTVYIVANGTNAVLVSTAPYGIENIRGTVYVSDAEKIILRKASVYNASKYMWDSCPDTTANILKNTIVIENGSVIDPAKIKKGTVVRVITKDKSTSGDAYIILVE